MASYESYISLGKQNLNTGYDYTIQQLISALGGLTNPNSDNYVPAEYREVIDPRLRSISEYLNQLGADGYQYEYSDILSTLNNATNAAYDARFNALDDANAQFNRDIATQQDSIADTLRSQYAQAIQSGVSRGMQSANILSSILGTTQAAAQSAQQLAEDRYQTGIDKQAQIVKDASDALTRSNAAYETLMSNIRQLYNDEIQEKTADLEYNASVADSNAQYAASKYTADTNYSQNVIGSASGIYNNNQSVLSAIVAAAADAASQDTYSANYLKAAQESAAAARYTADQSAASSRYAADRAADLRAAEEAARKAAEAQAAAEQKAREAEAALAKALAESNTKSSQPKVTYNPPAPTLDALNTHFATINGQIKPTTSVPAPTTNTVSVPKGQGYGLNTSAGANKAVSQTTITKPNSSSNTKKPSGGSSNNRTIPHNLRNAIAALTY